jgi:hypothetical protein
MLEQEQVKAERLQAEIDAGRLTPSTPAPEAASPPEPAPAPDTLQAAAAAAEAAEAMRADRRVDPVDAAIYRKAGALRREMLGEQVLHHAVAEQAAAERRKVPLELEEVDEIEARQVAAAAMRMAQAAPPEPPSVRKPASPPPLESKAPSSKPEAAFPDPDPELSPADLQALSEIRAMYRRLPPERLVSICRRPPKGMERLFAVLAKESGIGGAWPSGP